MRRQKNKKNIEEKRSSFNELHNRKLDELEDLQKQLPVKKKKLNTLKNNLGRLKNKKIAKTKKNNNTNTPGGGQAGNSIRFP